MVTFLSEKHFVIYEVTKRQNTSFNMQINILLHVSKKMEVESPWTSLKKSNFNLPESTGYSFWDLLRNFFTKIYMNCFVSS